MFHSRLFSVSGTATVLLFAIASPANAFLAFAAKKPGHLDHLHHAAHELKHAHEATGKNVGKAGQHVATAIGHIEAAIEHHKPHLQNRAGVTGALATAAHHHHHSQLHEALHAAKAAEKQLVAGNTAQAAKDISKAHHHVELAIHSHHALIAK